MVDTPRDPLVGTLVGGRYRVVARLAAGGMGAVYTAVQESLSREVALKVIRPGLIDDGFRARFEREARATSSLRDPHVVTVHDFGIDGELPFIVFEKLEGEDLAAALQARGRMPWRRGARVLRGIASALAAAHTAGVVHRDLKPSNVFLIATAADPAFAKVLDFGIAKLMDPAGAGASTEQGVVPGTPGYIAPERLVGAEADARADLYSLGVIAWEVLAGRPPFAANSPVELTIKHLQEPTPRLLDAADVPAALSALVDALLQKEPGARPADAAAVVAALDVVLEIPSEPHHAPVTVAATSTPLVTPTTLSTPQAPRRRARRIVAAVGGACVVAAAAVALWLVAPAERAALSLGQVRRVTDDVSVERDPALSLDARRLAYVAVGEGGLPDVFVRELSTGKAVNVTQSPSRAESRPAFSRDGAMIAYASRGEEGESLWLVNATGGKARELVATAATSPVFGVDGDTLFFATASMEDPRKLAADVVAQIWSVDLRSGQKKTVVEDLRAFEPALSPDGALLALLAVDGQGHRDLHVVSLRDGRRTQLTNDAFIDHNPIFADDRRLLFLSNRGGEMSLHALALTDEGAPRGAPTPFLSGSTAMAQATVAGQTLSYTSRSVSSAVEARSLDAKSGKLSAPRRIFEGPRELRAIDASADGAWLVMESTSGEDDLLLLSADGRENRLLTHDPAFDRTPRFVGDGLTLVFASNRDGPFSLWTATLGGTILKLGPPAACPVNAPAPSPDGARIAAHPIGCDGGVVLFDTGAATVRTLPVPAMPHAVPLAWRDDRTLIVNDAGSALGLVDVDTGSVTRVEMALGQVADLDGSRLLAFMGDGLVIVDGDDVRPLDLQIPARVTEASFAYAKKTRTLWTAQMQVEADIWVATLGAR